MEKTANSKQKMTLMLMQETLWQIEDKLKIIIEGLADHEADIIRIRRLNNQILHRIELMEPHLNKIKELEKKWQKKQ